MGAHEIRVAKRKSKRNIRTALLLGLLGGAVVAGLATIGPAVLAGFSVLKTPAGKNLPNSKLKRSLKLLLEKNFVIFTERDGKKHLGLTDAGRSYLRRTQALGYNVPKPKKWDGKWRIVMFDIKEARRMDRDQLRDELEAIGFYRFQNSAWFYPYDCEDLITLIKSDYRLGRSTVYIIAEEVENDFVLRKHFGLA